MSASPQPEHLASFTPARRVRSLDDVSLQIRDAILAGEIAEGARLPNERELAERFEVGRPTVREALRSLEALGIIEIRPGRSGGAYAARPSEATLGAALSTLVSLQGASAQELAEFRISFEADNAWWAAQRADDDDVANLEQLVAEMRRLLKQINNDWTPLTDADARWHEALARATKNRLRIGISLGLHEPRLRQVAALSKAHARNARTIPTALAKITRAVKAHDADVARTAMLEHIEEWSRLNPDVPDPPAGQSRSGRAQRGYVEPMGPELEQLRSLLEAPSPAVLTTYRKDGSANVSPVWFRSSDDALEVVIAEGDLKLRHLARDRRCILTVFETVAPFRGLEVRGEPELIKGDVTEARIAIAGRYLGGEGGRRFAAERRSPRGVLLRLPIEDARVWDLAKILPAS